MNTKSLEEKIFNSTKNGCGNWDYKKAGEDWEQVCVFGMTCSPETCKRVKGLVEIFKDERK